MAIFFLVFLTVYGSANFYVYYRGLQAIESLPLWVKIVYTVIFWSAAAFYIMSRTFLDLDNIVFDIILWIGAIWFAVLLYSFIYVLSVDLVRLGFKIFSFTPPVLFQNITATKLGLFIGAIGYLVLVVGYGVWNANNIQIRTINLTLPKKDSKLDSLNIAFFSDSHFSPILGTKKVHDILRGIEEIKPDLILTGGDIVDDKSKHLYRHKIDQELKKLKAPMGVIAINGNHEYIVGIRSAMAFIKNSGMTLLRDEHIIIDSSLVIVGRDDKTADRFAAGKRKPIEEVMKDVPRNLPVIMLDHQPYDLHLVEKAGVDLQLSGHTHQGQMFPINLIVSRIYELSWGYLQKGKTQFYVSSGVGTWGPPVRTGSVSELINLKITFKDEK